MRTSLRTALSAALLLASVGCSGSKDPGSVEPPGPKTPAIALAPATGAFPLSFRTVANTGAPAARVVNVTNTGGGTLATPVITTTAGMDAWVQTPITASGPPGGPYTLQVQPRLVAAGSYSGTIAVASAGAANSPRTFDVTYVVDSAQALAAGGCIASASGKICEAVLTAGAEAQVTSSSLRIRRGSLSAGGTHDLQSTNQNILRSVIVPGATTP